MGASQSEQEQEAFDVDLSGEEDSEEIADRIQQRTGNLIDSLYYLSRGDNFSNFCQYGTPVQTNNFSLHGIWFLFSGSGLFWKGLNKIKKYRSYLVYLITTQPRLFFI